MCWRIWWPLAWMDISGRYRRTVLGPLWSTITTGIFMIFLGFLYSNVMSAPMDVYIPNLTTGFVVWFLFAGTINESCKFFNEARAIILQRPLPFSIYILRGEARNFILFFHNLLILIPVALLYDIKPTWTTLLFFPGLIVIWINLLWISLVVATVSARFHDIPPIIQTVIQIAFFATPIIWLASNLEPDHILFMTNPFFHLMELLRQPLLGGVPGAYSVAYVFVLTVLGWFSTIVIFSKSRHKIAYWL